MGLCEALSASWAGVLIVILGRTIVMTDQPQSNPPAENSPKREVGTDEKGKTSEPVAVEIPPSKPVEEEPKPSPPAVEAKVKVDEGEKAAEQKPQSDTKSTTNVQYFRQSLFQQSSASQSAKCACRECDKVGCRCCRKAESETGSVTEGASSAVKKIRKELAMKFATEGPNSSVDAQEKTEQESQGSWTSESKKKSHTVFNATNIVLLAFVAGAVISTIIAVKRLRLQ